MCGLAPGRLGVGVAGGTHHAHEDLRFAHLAAVRIDNRDLLAGVVDEQFVYLERDRDPADLRWSNCC